MPVSTPVGRLLCQRNSLLRSHTATVISSKPVTGSKHHEVILSDTVLFPTGGGQPHDVGTIAGVKVVEVLRRGLECVHIVEEGVGEIGSEVEVKLEWGRRWDHMQQHSGQHLLSAIAEQEFKLDTVAWGLGKDRCHIELDLTKREGVAPTVDELTALEAKVNEVVRGAMKFEVVEEGMEVRPESMPEDLKEGGWLDRNPFFDFPCCGTHVSTTADLQCLKLLHTEKVRGKNLRLFFLFGDRVIATFQQSLLRERAIGSILSTGPEAFVDKITLATKQLKDSTRLHSDLRGDKGWRWSCGCGTPERERGGLEKVFGGGFGGCERGREGGEVSGKAASWKNLLAAVKAVDATVVEP
ncbi:Threonyl/alanyl tRNA synthetase [Chytridium lagenaria]|nr:Threonyl/alanyl tRNA synthetase [Chytridium lagenaria]